MEELRKIDNDEIVDSIMHATLQCGLTVAKVAFEKEKVNIHIRDAKQVVSIDREHIVSHDLLWLREEIERRLNE
jgi:hypothetical protein